MNCLFTENLQKTLHFPLTIQINFLLHASSFSQMQKNEEEKDDIENIHPDSKYDNWTIRSFVSYSPNLVSVKIKEYSYVTRH